MPDIIFQANRCLKCKNPSCQKGCPVQTDIPNIIKMFLDGKIEEAGKKLFDNNPLSVFCSMICPHENNCMGHCVLNKVYSPVKFFEIEEYISSIYLEKARLVQPKWNGHRLAIIGAGPAGLTLAFIMASRGYKITIIDSKDKIGGVLRYGIPEFRLPKSLLDKLLVRMYDLDIKFRPNTLIGPTLTIDDMFRDGYEAIFIGTGVWKPNTLKIPGETLGNVHFAIDYLKNPDSYEHLGDHVLIIGAGNVAIDVARTILHKSRTNVEIIFNRGQENMTALKEQIDLAKVDGVRFNYYLETLKIEDDGIVVAPVSIVDNQYVVKKDEAYKIECSSVIIAIGQGALSNIVNNTKNIDTKEKGLVVTTATGKTTRPGVFAAGDVVHGAKTVAQAVAATKLVADEIDEYIKSIK